MGQWDAGINAFYILISVIILVVQSSIKSLFLAYIHMCILNLVILCA